MSKKQAQPDNLSKKVKIQIGVCKRMVKEVAAYEKEVVQNEQKVQKMKDEDIRKQEEVLQETYIMIPDSKSRLERSVAELSELVESGDEVEAALLSEAREIISQYS